MGTPKFKLETSKGKGKGLKIKNKIVFEEEMPKTLLTYLHKNCGFEAFQVSEGMITGILEGLVKMGKLEYITDEKGENGEWKCSIVV